MRLPLVVSLARNQTLLDIVVERGGQPDAAYVVKVGDYSVVLLTIRNPLPPNTPQEQGAGCPLSRRGRCSASSSTRFTAAA